MNMDEFEPVYMQGTDGVDEECENMAEHSKSGKVFSWEKTGRPPSSPLKADGCVFTKGWDIPTCWAIDSNNLVWKDDSHGGCLTEVPYDYLLLEFDSVEEQNRILRILGMELLEPEWMKLARDHGWGPLR